MKLAGYSAVLRYSLGTTVFTELKYLTDLTITADATPIDVSNNSTGKFRQFITGKAGWTGSGTFIFDDSDGAYEVLLDLLNDGTDFDIELRVGVGTGKPEYTSTCLVTNVGIAMPNDGAITCTAELLGTSEITIGNQ